MTGFSMDDLKIDQPAGDGVKPVPPSEHLHEVGPESEVRGGHEASTDAPLKDDQP